MRHSCEMQGYSLIVTAVDVVFRTPVDAWSPAVGGTGATIAAGDCPEQVLAAAGVTDGGGIGTSF